MHLHTKRKVVCRGGGRGREDSERALYRACLLDMCPMVTKQNPRDSSAQMFQVGKVAHIPANCSKHGIALNVSTQGKERDDEPGNSCRRTYVHLSVGKTPEQRVVQQHTCLMSLDAYLHVGERWKNVRDGCDHGVVNYTPARKEDRCRGRGG